MSLQHFRYNILHLLSLFFLLLSGVFLIGLDYRIEGWVFYFFGIFSLVFSERSFAKNIILLYVSLALLGITPITTDTSFRHIVSMSITLGLAVIFPYIVTRFFYQTDTIRYGAFLTRKWTKEEWGWVIFTLIIGYFLLPYFLKDTLSYQNWTVKPGWGEIFVLFLGTNALGIWDELFFINTVLQILRKHFPFLIANIAQAVLFTSFLFELGFRGWGPFMIFPFAFAQGYVFRETKNLTYIISLHLALDLILFLALIHLHHGDWWVKVFF